MIVMWLLEIFLNELGILRTAGKQSTNEYRTLQQEFHNLLKETRVKVKCSHFLIFLLKLCMESFKVNLYHNNYLK